MRATFGRTERDGGVLSVAILVDGLRAGIMSKDEDAPGAHWFCNGIGGREGDDDVPQITGELDLSHRLAEAKREVRDAVRFHAAPKAAAHSDPDGLCVEHSELWDRDQAGRDLLMAHHKVASRAEYGRVSAGRCANCGAATGARPRRSG